MQLWLKRTFTKVDSTNVLQTENSFMQWTLSALYSKFKVTSHDKNNVVLSIEVQGYHVKY
jgi:hypothetical protein